MKNLIKYSSAILLSAILGTSANAGNHTDTVNLTGTIAVVLTVNVGTVPDLDLSADGPTTVPFTIGGNSPFSVSYGAAGTTPRTLTSGSDTISYTIAMFNGTTAKASGDSGGSNGSWSLVITTSGITSSTPAGTYTDTITLTITAA